MADARTLAVLRERYRGAVVVVDEMSLAGTAQARALLRIADRLEVARLVLVGDSRQLRGVQAGQPFRQMQQAGMAVAEMDELRRQQNPNLLAAVQDMIEGEPGEALERLGGNLREIPAEEIARIAAALWLRLSPGARAGTALLVPTRTLRAEVEEAVREGLEAEGALHGSSIEIETLVPLNLTRAEAGDPRNWREGDIALFNRERKNYRIRKDDACTVMEVEEDRVILAHPDGRPRHLKPDGDLRYRLDLFEAKTLTIREGERLRWTRNDRERGLVNGDRVEVLEIRGGSLRMRLSDGREVLLAPDDPQLRHLAYAYASTVHAAQGQTHDRVIAVLDTGAGPLVNQQTLYVQLSRAREEAMVLTDNREQLVETLEANTGERLTALEAIGEEVEPRAPKKRAVSGETATAFLDGLRAKRERHAEAEVALRRLAEAEAVHMTAREAAKKAEGAFTALPAVALDDRQTLRDRLAAAEAAQEAAHEVVAAAYAVLAAAEAADRTPPLDDAAMEAAKTDETGAGTRLETYRSLERALSAADRASKRLAPEGSLLDKDIDEASIQRHGDAAREAAAAFEALAQKAQAVSRCWPRARRRGLRTSGWRRSTGATSWPAAGSRRRGGPNGTRSRRERPGISVPGGTFASSRRTRGPRRRPRPRRSRRRSSRRTRSWRPSGAGRPGNTASRPARCAAHWRNWTIWRRSCGQRKPRRTMGRHGGRRRRRRRLCRRTPAARSGGRRWPPPSGCRRGGARSGNGMTT